MKALVCLGLTILVTLSCPYHTLATVIPQVNGYTNHPRSLRGEIRVRYGILAGMCDTRP